MSKSAPTLSDPSSPQQVRAFLLLERIKSLASKCMEGNSDMKVHLARSIVGAQCSSILSRLPFELEQAAGLPNPSTEYTAIRERYEAVINSLLSQYPID